MTIDASSGAIAEFGKLYIEACADIARLKSELRISRAKSRREKALRKAAEGERDAVRHELREYVAKNPNF